MSDETIADTARNDPRMKDPDGKFDRNRFDGYLRDAGLSERSFFAEQRDVYLRQQIAIRAGRRAYPAQGARRRRCSTARPRRATSPISP